MGYRVLPFEIVIELSLTESEDHTVSTRGPLASLFQHSALKERYIIELYALKPPQTGLVISSRVNQECQSVFPAPRN